MAGCCGAGPKPGRLHGRPGLFPTLWCLRPRRSPHALGTGKMAGRKGQGGQRGDTTGGQVGQPGQLEQELRGEPLGGTTGWASGLGRYSGGGAANRAVLPAEPLKAAGGRLR